MRLAENRATSRFFGTFDFSTYNYVNISWSAYYDSSLDSDDCFDFKVDDVIMGSWGGGSGCEQVPDSVWLDESSAGNDAQHLSFECGVDITCDTSVEIKFESEFSLSSEYMYVDCISIIGY